MECQTCERTADTLWCERCAKQKAIHLCNYWKLLREKIDSQKARMNELLAGRSAKTNYAALKETVESKRANVLWYRTQLATVKQSLSAYKSVLTSTGDPEIPPDLRPLELQSAALTRQVQTRRAALVHQVASVLQKNEYYPDWCIGELFKLEKALQYNQIVQFEDSLQVVDTSSHIITLKHTVHDDGLSEEHKEAIYHSLYQICELLLQASKYLRVALPFALEYNRKNYLLEDHSGLKHAIDLTDMLTCEAAMLYLYLDLSYLQQLQGVDLNRVKGLFDVKALLECDTLGQWKHYVKEYSPTFELQLSSSVRSQQIQIENQQLSDEWLDLSSDDD